MPRSKNQKHYHRDIDDPHRLLDGPWRMVNAYKSLYGLTQAQAVADLIRAGYDQLVSFPLPADLRVDGNGETRQEKSGSTDRRTPGREAA